MNLESMEKFLNNLLYDLSNIEELSLQNFYAEIINPLRLSKVRPGSFRQLLYHIADNATTQKLSNAILSVIEKYDEKLTELEQFEQNFNLIQKGDSNEIQKNKTPTEAL